MSLQQRTQKAIFEVTSSSMTQAVAKGMARSNLDVVQFIPVLSFVNDKEKTAGQRTLIRYFGCFLIMLAASVPPECTDAQAICLVMAMYINLFGSHGHVPATYRPKILSEVALNSIRAAVRAGSAFAAEEYDNIIAADQGETEAARDDLFSASPGEYPDLDQALQHMTAACREMGLPLPLYYPRAMMITLVDDNMNIELAGVLGVLAYAIGKRLTATNVEGFDRKRYQNIIDRYLKLVKTDPNPFTGALGGPSRPRQSLYPIINRAFGNDAAARKYMVHGFIQLSAEEETVTAGAAFLPFRLLRFAGIASYPIVTNFLNTYEYAYNIPGLKGGIAYYCASCMHLMKVPEEVRPYIKLIHQDRTDMFHRPDIGSLLNVAVVVMSETYPSLEDFEHDKDDEQIAIFNEVRERMERKEKNALETEEETATKDPADHLDEYWN